jgi:hypothetical protein
MLAGSSLHIRNALDAPIATTKIEHALPANPKSAMVVHCTRHSQRRLGGALNNPTLSAPFSKPQHC